MKSESWIDKLIWSGNAVGEFTLKHKKAVTISCAIAVVAMIFVASVIPSRGDRLAADAKAQIDAQEKMLELDNKRLQMAKEARLEEERLMALRQESERRAAAEKVAQREADEQRKREEARMDEEKARKKENERNAKMAVWRSAANGSTPNDTFETLLNKLDSNGYTSDQQELVFNREGKDKWFVVRGPVKDVGTFLGSKYVTVQVNSGNYCDIYHTPDLFVAIKLQPFQLEFSPTMPDVLSSQIQPSRVMQPNRPVFRSVFQFWAQLSRPLSHRQGAHLGFGSVRNLSHFDAAVSM